MTPIKYIGLRPHYRDGAFGTGIEFDQGQTQMVPDYEARLMLRHPSVYVLGDGPVVPGDEAPKQEDADPDQDARDVVAAMDKDALKAYAKTHYRVDLDGRISVEKLRAKVIGMIDQFGVE